MPTFDQAIDWSKATVLPTENRFNLRVPLAGETHLISSGWADEFRRRAQGGHHWSGVSFRDGMIEVDAVEAGAEDEVRKYLDQLVDETNIGAEEARAIADQEAAKKAEVDAERQKAADEMAERFRSS